jgi:hypothetical protein
MTPEDLTAIGITNPHHREIIKAHIDDLQVNDSLPHYVPGSIDEWLRLLRLDEYILPLQNEGFQSVKDMTKLNEEDLEDIGIIKLGHQKKILLAIKRVKDILNGKNVVPSVNYCQPSINPGHYSQVYIIVVFQKSYKNCCLILARRSYRSFPEIAVKTCIFRSKKFSRASIQLQSTSHTYTLHRKIFHRAWNGKSRFKILEILPSFIYIRRIGEEAMTMAI